MIKKLVRKSSGVQVLTVLTSPYPNAQKFSCGHNCAYCPKEREIILNCKIINLNVFANYTSVFLKTTQKLDEVKVITYITFSYNNQKVYVLGSSDFDESKGTFKIKILNKYNKFFSIGGNCTVTKVEQPRSYISTEPVIDPKSCNFDPSFAIF